MRKSKLYEQLLAEKDTQLGILAREIDWLRAQLGRPTLGDGVLPTATPLEAPQGDPTVRNGEWVSEFDEAEAIIAANNLSAVHLPEILDGLGVGTSDLA